MPKSRRTSGQALNYGRTVWSRSEENPLGIEEALAISNGSMRAARPGSKRNSGGAWDLRGYREARVELRACLAHSPKPRLALHSGVLRIAVRMANTTPAPE